MAALRPLDDRALRARSPRPAPRPAAPRTGAVRRLGGMAILAAEVLGALLRPPFAWRREFLIQSVAILRTAFWPIAISVLAFGFSGPGLQAGNFLTAFGSTDRSGGFMVVAIVREFGTFITASVVAGTIGTRLTAELGTRKVRGELDALETLGVRAVPALVAPRVLALIVVMALLEVPALLFGVFGGFIASVGVLGGTQGAFLESFFANATFLDLAASLLKLGLFGLLVGVVCSWHGLAVEGGAQGVGRAVNRAVVGSLVAIFVVNLVYTQWFLASFPDVNVLR